MKTLDLRRGIFVSLCILLFMFIFAIKDPDDSSDILSDPSRRFLALYGNVEELSNLNDTQGQGSKWGSILNSYS